MIISIVFTSTKTLQNQEVKSQIYSKISINLTNQDKI